jgi:hypothetical protein
MHFTKVFSFFFKFFCYFLWGNFSVGAGLWFVENHTNLSIYILDFMLVLRLVRIWTYNYKRSNYFWPVSCLLLPDLESFFSCSLDASINFVLWCMIRTTLQLKRVNQINLFLIPRFVNLICFAQVESSSYVGYVERKATCFRWRFPEQEYVGVSGLYSKRISERSKQGF